GQVPDGPRNPDVHRAAQRAPGPTPPARAKRLRANGDAPSGTKGQPRRAKGDARNPTAASAAASQCRPDAKAGANRGAVGSQETATVTGMAMVSALIRTQSPRGPLPIVRAVAVVGRRARRPGGYNLRLPMRPVCISSAAGCCAQGYA